MLLEGTIERPVARAIRTLTYALCFVAKSFLEELLSNADFCVDLSLPSRDRSIHFVMNTLAM